MSSAIFLKNKPDFTTDTPDNMSTQGSYFSTMSEIMDDIQAAGNKVKEEGIEDLYVQKGEASLGTTKDSGIFDKSINRIRSMLTSAKKIHSDIMQNIDSKFTKGMDKAFTTLNKVNGAENPYKSKYTQKEVSAVRYKAGSGPYNAEVYTKKESYSLVEILDGKASPIKAAKDVYDERLKRAKELLANKDQLSDEQIKALEGKSAEDIVAAQYPGQLPDYQKLKASRYYEENKESLQYVDTGLKVAAGLAMIGGVLLAPVTGGASLYATYAGGAYLAADSTYSAVTGHTMITGDQLSTEERIWAGIDAAVTVVSMGSAAYLTKLAKAGTSGSTLLKGLATAGKYADDVNDVSKVVYATATGQDPTSALGNLVLGQVMGYGLGKGSDYLNVKFGRGSTPDLAADLPSGGSRKAPSVDVDLPGGSGRVPKVDTSNLNLRSQAAPDITVGRGAADIDAPSISGTKAVPDLPSAKQVAAESAAGVVGGARVKDVDVPRVKDVATPSRTGDVGVPKVDSQSSAKMSEPSRLEYLRNNMVEYLQKN
ncbi:hypothetical protein ACVRXQ_11190 [Streptococcus panodentis]|uniref:LXG domain-containing protein n=1 Tax=Streptococcus panodentis TaxID=1581472 RepID=A0ABS5AZF0_9STRE|nr:hypothetical protein [Streptococcus panodentis]MBP2621641.1 hypothetical protein [Streptococcus panodentis]